MNSISKLTIRKLNKIFKYYPLYSQENTEPKVILELFIPNQNIYWLLTEGNQENDDFIFFGYSKITYGELGYVSFKELLKNTNYGIFYIIHKKPILLEELKEKYNK